MDQEHKKDQFNLRAFGSDVLTYSFGQVLLLVFGLVQSLIIPKYLSTADYGYWQLFLLYTAYVGILHLGFLDGILVRWAGKEFEEIKQEVPMAFRFLLLEQFLVVGVLALVLIAIDIPFLEIGLAVLANAIIVNILTFFIFTAQAVKRFKLVTAVNISRGGLFLLLVLALFAGGKFGYGDLYLATIVTGSILLILFAIHLRGSLFSQATPDKIFRAYGKENISIGIFVLLGNITAALLMTVDRLTVRLVLPHNPVRAIYLCDIHVRFHHTVRRRSSPSILPVPFRIVVQRADPGLPVAQTNNRYLLGRGTGYVFPAHRVDGVLSSPLR